MDDTDVNNDDDVLIWKRLNTFITNNKVPNIIFHGEHKSGKKTILNDFIDKLYHNNKAQIKEHVMSVNCAHGKGIKFVREDLKQFAKTNILHNNDFSFKSVILLNADTLTIDAQSALRRCIELFTNNTRFFIVVENIDKLLKPILSRFCQIYIPSNLRLLGDIQYCPKACNVEEDIEIIKKLEKIIQKKNKTNVFNMVEQCYETGISAMDVLQFYKLHPEKLHNNQCFESILFAFAKMKKEFRNENFLLFFLLNLLFLSLEEGLENLTFM
jgi:DNA polymerase III delta prime subunit